MIRCPERMAATLLVLFAGLSAAVSASTFEVKNGVRYFDIVIAYEGTDDVADKEKFSRVLPHFAYGIYQCSQGRHKLRKVKIFSKPSKDGGVDNYTPKANACDVRWATTANTWPRATVGADITVGVSDAIIKGEHRGRIEFSDKPIKGKNTSFDLTGDGYKSNYETRLAGAVLALSLGFQQAAQAAPGAPVPPQPGVAKHGAPVPPPPGVRPAPAPAPAHMAPAPKPGHMAPPPPHPAVKPGKPAPRGRVVHPEPPHAKHPPKHVHHKKHHKKYHHKKHY